MLEVYRQMLVSLFVVALAVIVVMTVAGLLIDYYEKDAPFVLAVMLAGTLGALFSALMRLYNLRDLPQALISPQLRGLRNTYLLIYSLVPVAMGFTASAVVYLAALAGIIQGRCSRSLYVC